MPEGEIDITFRPGINPLRCASCYAQARGAHPWPPVRRMRLTPGACGKNFVFFTP